MSGPRTSERVAEAFAYAAELHQDQTRKGSGIPYVSHLLAVAGLVLENGGDEDQVIAALLHDGPEDQGGQDTLDEIRQRFGDRAAKIVEECSDTLVTPKPPWLTRKRQYLHHLETASTETLLVSIADKVHNLGSITRDYRTHGDALWSRFTKGCRGTTWYYQRLLQVYERRDLPQLASLRDELRRLLNDLMGMIRDNA